MRLRFNLLLFLILVLAGTFRLASYDFSLPYIHHPDEPNYYLEALKWRGFYELGGSIPGYPPGIVVINSVVQTLLADDSLKMPHVIRIVRLLSLTVNLMTLVLIAFTARRIAGAVAGLVAAVSWGIAPAVVSGGVYATADPYTYFFTVMAVWLALIALQDSRRPLFVIGSVVAGLFAVLFKYPALPALIPGFAVTGYWMLTRQPKAWRLLVWQTVMVLGVGVFLLFVYQAGRMDIREADTLRTSGLSNLVNPLYITNNLFYVFVPIGGVLAVLIIVLGTGRLLLSDRLKSRTLAVLICLLPLIAIPWIASSFSFVTDQSRLKDVLPATALASVLLGVGVVEIGKLFRQAHKYGTALMVTLVGIGVWFPNFQANFEYVMDTQPADRRVDIRRWADDNIPAGTVIVDNDNHKTFNPFWSGLVNNRQWFDWLESDDVLESSIPEWREDFGASYLALNARQLDRIQSSEVGQAFLDELLLLREFINPPHLRGPQILFYRLWQPDHTLDVTFGEGLHLIGYDVSPLVPAPGDNLSITFYWRATSVPPVEYSLFLHLLPLTSAAEVVPITQYDGPPVSASRPTYTWDEPTETLISQPITLTLPQAMAAGSYKVSLGLYDWSTLIRLPVTPSNTSAGDTYELLQIEIGR